MIHIMLVTSLLCIKLVANPPTDRQLFAEQYYNCIAQQVHVRTEKMECDKKLKAILKKINKLCIQDQMNETLCKHLLKD